MLNHVQGNKWTVLTEERDEFRTCYTEYLVDGNVVLYRIRTITHEDNFREGPGRNSFRWLTSVGLA